MACEILFDSIFGFTLQTLIVVGTSRFSCMTLVLSFHKKTTSQVMNQTHDAHQIVHQHLT
jgi:hypothetical protein